MPFYFGAHYNLKENSVIECFDHVKRCGGNFIQVNTYSSLLKDIKSINLKKENLGIVIHSHYQINIANNTKLAIASLIKDIKIAEEIGAIGVVIHTGKSVHLEVKKAKKNMYDVLIAIAKATNGYKTKIILETSSGQGTETCSEVSEFAEFFNLLKNSEYSDRYKVCIDTCHIFAAGYDISEKATFMEYLEYLESEIGDNICLIHLNNSKKELGSRVDRHHNLKDGYINESALLFIFNIFKKRNIPVILETPNRFETLSHEIEKCITFGNKNKKTVSKK